MLMLSMLVVLPEYMAVGLKANEAFINLKMFF